MRSLTLAVLMGLAGLSARAASAADAAAAAKAVAPYVEEQTLLIQRADLKQLDLGRLAMFAGTVMPDLGPEKVLMASVAGATFVRGLTDAGAKEVYVLVNLADMPGEPTLLITVDKDDSRDRVAKAVQALPGVTFESVENVPGGVLAGGKAAVARALANRTAARPEVEKALAAVAESDLQTLLLPTAETRKVIEEVMPRLPKEAGGQPSTIVTHGLQWAALGIDTHTDKQPAFRLVIQSTDKAAAERLHTLIGELARAATSAPQLADRRAELAAMIEVLTPRVDGSQLRLELNEKNGGLKSLSGPLAGSLEAARENARRSLAANSLKQFAVAMHMYHEDKKSFPPAASVGKDGRPLLSWRVHILPYLDQDALYKKFRLDEPWDSEHNKQLIEQMPLIYANPLAKLLPPGKTAYVVPTGKGTIFGGSEGTKISDIRDGTSNTILIVEGPEPQTWTAPADFKVDSKVATAIVGLRKGVVLVALADGSVRVINVDEKPEQLQELFHIHDSDRPK